MRVYERVLSNGEECPVKLWVGKTLLEGSVCVPAGATSLVMFAHGSGSSRYSPRDRYVAGVLRDAGLATLLFDLLTEQEEAVDSRTGRLRFDIRLLADRMVGATDWARQNDVTRDMNIGYFGASTGAAAALVAAAERPDAVSAIVSRGGRPDLAGPALPYVKAPTLLIVGGRDYDVLVMNRKALERLPGPKELVVVPGATHLFEEPGALEQAASVARDWFTEHLGRRSGKPRKAGPVKA